MYSKLNDQIGTKGEKLHTYFPLQSLINPSTTKPIAMTHLKLFAFAIAESQQVLQSKLNLKVKVAIYYSRATLIIIICHKELENLHSGRKRDMFHLLNPIPPLILLKSILLTQ